MNQLAFVYAADHDYDKALEYMTTYAAINPGEADPVNAMGDLYWIMGRFDEALEKYQKTMEMKPGVFQSGAKAGYLCAMSENYGTALRFMEREIASSPSGDLRDDLYWFKGFMDCWLGRTEMALADLTRARQMAESTDNRYLSAICEWLKAYIYFDKGEMDIGVKSYQIWQRYYIQNDQANLVAHMAENDFYLGWINLKSGRIDTTRLQLAAIEKRLRDIPVQWLNRRSFEHDLLAGETALADGAHEKAISLFKKQTLQDIPSLSLPQIVIYNTPFLKDGLARAFQQAGKIDKAISEYERLIDPDMHRNERYLIHPLYHYRLALLYEQKGAAKKAIEQHLKFLRLWKDADKSWPELGDAEARLNALKKGALQIR
jgi:tetratricopeptide (TPR) repeat protein